MPTKIIEGFETYSTFSPVGSASNIRNEYDIHLQGNKSLAFDKIAIAGYDKAGVYKDYPTIDGLIYDGFIANWYITAAAKAQLVGARVLLDDGTLSPLHRFVPNLYEYECDVEPTAWTPAWTLVAPSVDYATSAGGILTIQNPVANTNRCFYRLSDPNIGWIYTPPGNPYKYGVVTAGVKIDSGTPAFQCSLEIKCRGVTVPLDVQDGLVSFYTGSSPSGLVDTSQFVYLRLVISPEDQKYWAYVNGKFFGMGDTSVPSGSDSYILFGANRYGINSLTLAQQWAFVRWGHIHDSDKYAEFCLDHDSILEDTWNQQDLDQRSPTVLFNGFDVSDIKRISFVADAKEVNSVVSGIYLDNFLAVSSNYVYEQPVFLAEWTMNARIVESFDGVSVDDLSKDWFAYVVGGTGTYRYATGHMSLGGLQLAHNGSSCFIRKTFGTALSFAPYGSDNNSSIQIDFKITDDTKIPRVQSMDFVLYTDGANYFTYTLSTGAHPIVPGWNTLLVDIKNPTSVTGVPDLSNITRISFGNTLNAVYPDDTGMVFSDLRWSGFMWAKNGNCPKIDYNVKTSEFASIKFDKTSTLEPWAGIYATYLSPLNFLVFDEYSIDFWFSDTDAAKTDHIEIVLDESKRYTYDPEQFLVSTGFVYYHGIVLPDADGWTAFGSTVGMTVGGGEFSCDLGVAAAGGYEKDFTSLWTDQDDIWVQVEPRIYGLGFPLNKALIEIYCKNTYYPFYLEKTAINHYDEQSNIITTTLDLSSSITVPLWLHIYNRGEYEILRNNITIYKGKQKPANISSGNKVRFGRTASSPDAGYMTLKVVKVYNSPVNPIYNISTNKVYSYINDFLWHPTSVNEDPTYQIQGTDIYTVSGSALIISSAGLNAEEFIYVDSDRYGGWDLNGDGFYKAAIKCDPGAVFPRAGVRLQYQNLGVELYVHDDPAYPSHKVYFGHPSDPGGSFTSVFDSLNYHYYSIRARWYDGTANLFIDGVLRATVQLHTYGYSANRMCMGHIAAHAAGGGVTNIYRPCWDALPREQAIYRSKQLIVSGFNHYSFKLSEPDVVVGEPSLMTVGRVYYFVRTKNPTDLLSDPYIDTFGTESVQRLAKTDYVANDGSMRWLGKILSFGSVSKNLNERVGNYSISDINVKIENASGYMGKLLQDEGLNMHNSSFAIKYGLADGFYEDFITLFRGAVQNVEFDNYEFSMGLTDPVPQFFNRLPNQYITRASFPLLPDNAEGLVAPIIIGEVTDDFGALKPVAVDWRIHLVAATPWRTASFSLKRSTDTDPIRHTFSITGFESYYDDTNVSLLVTRITDAMNLALGSPPSTPFVSASFDAVKRKFKITVTEPTADNLTLHSATDNQTGLGKLWVALGFSAVEDKSGSRDVESDYSAWNFFVVARHPTYKPTPEPSVFFEDKTSPAGNIIWYHNTKTADGLSWTMFWTENVCCGDRDIRCNATGFSDTMADDGSLVTNPVTALYFILRFFVGFPVSLLEDTGFTEAANTSDIWHLRCDGALTEDSEWNAFIEDYCKNFKIDIWMTNQGLIRPGIFVPSISDIEALNVTDLSDILEGSFKYDADFGGIINRVRQEFKKNYVDGEFKKSANLQNDNSINACKRVYDWPDGTLRFNWVRDWYTANRISQLYLDMFSSGNATTTIKLPMIKDYIPELTQRINVSAAAGPSYRYDSNLGFNVRGFENRLHRITGVEIDLTNYVVELKLQDVYNLTSRCFYLGDRLWAASELDWLTATQEHRIKYGYLCDRITGVFTDGHEGKRLC